MKIAPVSADLLVKLGLVLAGAGLVWYLGRKASGAVTGLASDAAAAAAGAVNAVNPWNNDNVINQTANRAVEWATGVPGDNLGSLIYDAANWNQSDSRFYREPPPPIPVTPTTPGGALQNDYGTNFIYF